ncbi:P-loop containing nucleoside triphosphate hydrolase protein [Diplogelasinospora grovesii]|uniref:RNA helicase n=1 Tax=Diplogelasinospora grovesii TaxID=303347 RepID=A0AAN6MZJ4_9PEZI|nr:P-loop containing nucleoside triphosphate hydrolase protein [Diplogelasinospora grovesii]
MVEEETIAPDQKTPPRLADWVPAQKYDYSAYTREAESAWDCNARVYEWDGDEGDVGPEFPELEVQIFGDPEKRGMQGVDFAKIDSITVTQEGPVHVHCIEKFEDAGLHPVMLKNIELAGYQVPTPIQRYAIPSINQGFDLIAIAQTGSGKTAAYLIPILNQLMGKAKQLAAPRPNPAEFGQGAPRVRAEPLVLVVCPTRELAIQIFNEARKFAYRTMLRPCVLYGGCPASEQRAQIQKGCDILVATPGRLVDFMEMPNILSLRRMKFMVIDEADEMIADPGWNADISKIMGGGDGNIKYVLCSATFPKQARDLAREYLSEQHVRIRVGRAGSSHECIKQNIVWVEPSLKKKALEDLIRTMPPVRTIIFVNSKRAADDVDDFLFNMGFPCTSMHSDRTQKEREAAMRAFRGGAAPILITTGVTARGIDVRKVMHVINYDLPSLDHGGIEEYVHRIGRTGRIGHRGLATSFYCDRDEPIGSVLTRTLLETGQDVPDFLEHFIPEGEAREHLKFEADSDYDPEEANDEAKSHGDDAETDTGFSGGWC